MKYQFTIQGRPASKKNSRRNFGHISLPSKAYERFEEDALKQLMTKRPTKPLTCKLSVGYIFYQKGKMHQDIDNAMASINDVLQKAGIIADDDLIIGGVFIKYSSSDWSTRVNITEIEQ